MPWWNWFYQPNFDTSVKRFWSWLKTNHNLTITNLSSSWWSLTLSNRKSIVNKIVEGYCISLPNKLQTRPDSTKPWFSTACLGRSILQATLIGDMSNHEGLWLGEWNYNGKPRSYFVNPLVKLPMFVVNSICVSSNFYHAINAIQIDKDITKLDSWMFIGNGSAGVIPADGSHPQLKHNSELSIFSYNVAVAKYTTTSIGPAVHDFDPIIVRFHIP
jgi:hypothetical protein